jgi:uncharacterized protein YndB with AHSA1/START domain
MSEVHCEILIARPVSAVFDYFLNPDKYVPNNAPEIDRIERSPSGPTVAGTTFRFHQTNGRSTTSRFTLVKPNRELAFDGVVGPLRPHCRFTFDDVADGTRVRFTAQPNPPLPLKPLSPLLARKGRHLWTQRLARAKAALEG